METTQATSATSANQTENLTFPVYVGKDETAHYFSPDVLKNLPSLIGKLISMFSATFFFYADFPKKSLKVVIPAATGGKGEKERSGKALQTLAKVIFDGMEREQETTDKAKIAVLNSFRAKGYKFSSYSFAAVNEAIKVKMQNQLQKINLQRELTQGIKENKVMIGQTTLIKEVRAIVKEKRNAAAIDFMKSKKIAGLPAIVES